MTWTCDVKSFTEAGYGVGVVTVLSDGVQKFQQSFQTNGTKKDLRAQVNAFTAAKDQVTTKGDISTGPLDLTPDVVTPPSIDPELAQFRSDLQDLRRADRASGDGLATTIDTDAIRSSVQSAISKHPDYEAYL